MIVEWFEVETIPGVESILVTHAIGWRQLTDPELDEQIRWFTDETTNGSVERTLRAERAWRDRLEGDQG